MHIPEEFNKYTASRLQPFGIMPEGLPSIWPPFGDYKHFKVSDQFTYISKRGIIVQVEEDMLTDLASVPLLFRGLLKVPGRESAGAVVHDVGYASPLRPRYNIISQNWELLSRGEWDSMFNEINKLAGVGRLKRLCLNLGLKIGGWWYWRKYKKYNPSTFPVAVLPLKREIIL